MVGACEVSNGTKQETARKGRGGGGMEEGDGAAEMSNVLRKAPQAHKEGRGCGATPAISKPGEPHNTG